MKGLSAANKAANRASATIDKGSREQNALKTVTKRITVESDVAKAHTEATKLTAGALLDHAKTLEDSKIEQAFVLSGNLLNATLDAHIFWETALCGNKQTPGIAKALKEAQVAAASIAKSKSTDAMTFVRWQAACSAIEYLEKYHEYAKLLTEKLGAGLAQLKTVKAEGEAFIDSFNNKMAQALGDKGGKSTKRPTSIPKPEAPVLEAPKPLEPTPEHPTENAPPAEEAKPRAVFGVELSELMEKQKKEYPNLLIPKFFYEAVKVIEKQSAFTEGIFRIEGNRKRQQTLMDALDYSQSAKIAEEADVHVLCSLLKKYLRAIPTPLIPFEEFDNFCDIPECYDPDEQTTEFQDLIEKLPAQNATFLAFICEMLLRVSQHSAKNLMPITNLSCMLAPNILYRNPEKQSNLLQDSARATAVFNVLIEYSADIFTKVTRQEPPHDGDSHLLRASGAPSSGHSRSPSDHSGHRSRHDRDSEDGAETKDKSDKKDKKKPITRSKTGNKNKRERTKSQSTKRDEPDAAEAKPAEAKPAEATPPAEAKPTEATPVAEAKPAEAKPAEAKPAEATPAAAPVQEGASLTELNEALQEAKRAREEAEKAKEEARLAQEEIQRFKDEIKRAKKEMEQAREEAHNAAEEARAAREETQQVSEELAKQQKIAEEATGRAAAAAAVSPSPRISVESVPPAGMPTSPPPAVPPPKAEPQIIEIIKPSGIPKASSEPKIVSPVAQRTGSKPVKASSRLALLRAADSDSDEEEPEISNTFHSRLHLFLQMEQKNDEKTETPVKKAPETIHEKPEKPHVEKPAAAEKPADKPRPIPRIRTNPALLTPVLPQAQEQKTPTWEEFQATYNTTLATFETLGNNEEKFSENLAFIYKHVYMFDDQFKHAKITTDELYDCVAEHARGLKTKFEFKENPLMASRVNTTWTKEQAQKAFQELYSKVDTVLNSK